VYLKLKINEIIVGDTLRYKLEGCLSSKGGGGSRGEGPLVV
jgi:hypothetical protein